jgi:hypothetical protein
LLQTEQNNTVVAYGERFILKLFCHWRRGCTGLRERSFLTEKARFTHTPAVAGTVTYHPVRGAP